MRPSSDLLFTQCGGKDRFKKAYQALDAAAVPTAIIADIDILADQGKFRELFEAMGGDYPSIQASYNVLESSVRNQAVVPERSKVREGVVSAIGGSKAIHLTKTEIAEVAELIRTESGWRHVKRKGSGAIDSGNPSAAFESIIAACKLRGLFILPIGELERFHSSVPGNKQAWLRQVLEGELFKTSHEAQTLMKEVRAFVATRQ